MDYSHGYFPGAQPYHQFIGIAPLTPSHSHSAGSDDFTTSPPDVYEQFPTNGIAQQDQFAAFDNYHHFNTTHPAFPGPPTPPTQHPVSAAVATAGVAQQAQAQPINGGSASADLRQSLSSSVDALPTKAELEEQGGRQGSTEEEELTPAQSRRKAQNRAAQRAFRERKERHVKDLETRLHELEAAKQQATTENERLKRDLQKVSTENEILRATSGNGGASPNSHSPTTTGPLSYNPTDFYSNLLQNHPNKAPSHRIVASQEGHRLLAAGATWDLIMSHELFKRGLVDIQCVSDRLKGQAKCDGQGPVFEERAILEAIAESVANGSDELL